MNFYNTDEVLQQLLKRYLPSDFYTWADHELEIFGEKCATDFDKRAAFTDRDGQPKLIKYNAFGEDISEVRVNEGYLKTVEETYQSGIVGYVHKEIPDLQQKGNYIYSYAQGYLLSQTEPGFYCPVTLTMATAYLLDQYADDRVRERFLPHVLSTGDLPLYEGATFLTERQGGSDVGANETIALKDGDHYKLYGEKYFASNAGMCGVAMVLARIEEAAPGTKGLSLFTVPWRNSDESLNGIRIRRLKDKLGVRAVPSGEVEFDGAHAYLVGDPSKGFYYMMEALNLSRVCNAIASLGIMRRAFTEARNYAFTREAFGQKLADYPMIKDTLVQMTVKHEAELRATFELIERFDRVMRKPETAVDHDKIMTRLLIALIKRETAEQAIHFSHEAIELYGGNGYIEDFVTPRLLRDAQVLTVWEGTANILGLEVLRLMKKYHAHSMFCEEIEQRLAALPPAFDTWKKTVENGVRNLINLSNLVLASDSDTQTFHCKKIADLMTRIFESTVIITEAVTGDERIHKVMEIFMDLSWGEPAAFDSGMKTIAYFDDLVTKCQAP